MQHTTQAKVITPQELKGLRRPLPKSWLKAAGLLRRHRRALQKHIETIRREWHR